jgi:hypothetical protein
MSNDCLVAVCCVVCVVVQKWDDLASRGGEIKISDLTKNGMTVTKKSQLIEIILTKSFIDFVQRKGDCYTRHKGTFCTIIFYECFHIYFRLLCTPSFVPHPSRTSSLMCEESS